MEERVAVPCPLCGAGESIFLWESCDPHLQTPDRYVRCINCELVRIDPRLTDRALARFWEQLYATRQDATERWTLTSAPFVPFLTRLRALTGGGRLLDIGCGEGTFLNAAKECGFEPFGTEISPTAIASAETHFALTNIRLAGHVADARFPADFFDVVCLLDVIEHLADPRAELIELRRIMRPLGTIVIRTPNVDALSARVLRGRWHLSNSTHIVLFSLRTLTRMLRECGFQLTRVEKDFTGEDSFKEFFRISQRKDFLAVRQAMGQWRSGKVPFRRVPRSMAGVLVRRGLRYVGGKLGRGEALLVLAQKKGELNLDAHPLPG